MPLPLPAALFFGIALLYFLAKLCVSYDSRGGMDGGVPVLDGAVFPPIAAIFGLWLWLGEKHLTLWGGGFTLFLIWLVLTIVAGLAIWFIGASDE